MHVLKGHSGPVRAVAFSPNATDFATAGDDGVVNVWNLMGATVKVIDTHVPQLTSIAFTFNGASVIVGSITGLVQVGFL